MAEVKPTSGRRHLAGPLVGGVQVCLRCAGVLTDYRNSMVPDGSGPLLGWEDGAWIEVRGDFMSKMDAGESLLPPCGVRLVRAYGAAKSHNRYAADDRSIVPDVRPTRERHRAKRRIERVMKGLVLRPLGTDPVRDERLRKIWTTGRMPEEDRAT